MGQVSLYRVLPTGPLSKMAFPSFPKNYSVRILAMEFTAAGLKMTI
jgi:hypothetical protein